METSISLSHVQHWVSSSGRHQAGRFAPSQHITLIAASGHAVDVFRDKEIFHVVNHNINSTPVTNSLYVYFRINHGMNHFMINLIKFLFLHLACKTCTTRLIIVVVVVAAVAAVVIVVVVII